MSGQEDIIKSIDELLDDPGYWDQILQPPPRTEPPPPPPKPLPQPRPPKVGTLIQRSDHVNRRKQAILLQPPPPPPKRRQTTTSTAARPSTDAPAEQQPPLLMPAGPLPPPPIRVQIEPGLIVEVPHFAVHVSRRYKPRTPQGRYILRFSRTGELRYRRRIE
ncbi:hypothetical protein RF55_14091 [Lasius niger]|uniref:Uncharacterized protein n=1 Tax=Lasius niger TaxID=67767 RepID=A0A0J7K956_LASNI|nr:hypothetical protein RF55_14094 [Lasius niger]KMQ86829.1 hypothetical protein RF55_14091 [Lasius niger]